MSINIGLLNATGKLERYRSVLETGIAATIKKVSEYFELSNIDITVAPFQKGEESPSGIGGYALSAHRLEILIDAERGDIGEIIESELLDVLAHELHHCLRMGLEIPSKTLAQHLIMEGLACHFEHTITGGKQSLLFQQLHGYDWREALVKMQPQLDEVNFSFGDLFLGHAPDQFPKYAGYWIGFNLVAQFMENHNASDMDVIGLAAEEFFLIS